MRVVVALVAFLALTVSGCSDAPESTPEDAPADGTSSEGVGVAAVAPAPPVVEVVAVSYDGSLGTVVHGCVFPAGVCPTHAVVPESADLVVERPGSNVTAVDLEATWTAQTPATATLTFGFMVMASCDGCNDTMFGEVTGTSPLRLQVSGVDVPLDAETVVHVYAYNPQGVVFNDAVPGYAVVSVEQPYHIEGTVTVAAPAPATSSGPAA